MCYFERERHCRIYSLVFEGLNCDIELTPALTDFKGPTIFICYRRISVIANIEIKEKLFKGPKKIFVMGAFPLLAGPLLMALERDSTVFCPTTKIQLDPALKDPPVTEIRL